MTTMATPNKKVWHSVHPAWVKRHAGPCQSPRYTSALKDVRPWIAQVTDNAAKHHRSAVCTKTFSTDDTCRSRLWHFHFALEQSGLCFFVLRAQTYLNPVGAVSSFCVLRRQYSKRNVDACPCHICTLRTSSTPWFLRLQKTDSCHNMSHDREALEGRAQQV